MALWDLSNSATELLKTTQSHGLPLINTVENLNNNAFFSYGTTFGKWVIKWTELGANGRIVYLSCAIIEKSTSTKTQSEVGTLAEQLDSKTVVSTNNPSFMRQKSTPFLVIR